MESRSTEMKTQSELAEIILSVSIPEIYLPFLMTIDDSPSVAIRKLVIRDFQQIPWSPEAESIHAMEGYTDDSTLRIKVKNFVENARAHGSLKQMITTHQILPVWNQDNFDKFILALMESMETRGDIDELLSFLIAYGSGESNKPTAIQLKNRMSNQIAESNPEIWNQHLRKCKARLTITAKNLKLPKPFGKPYGKSPNRKHPIDRDLLSLLIPWIDGSNERCQISLDDQSHEESIEILREFTPPEFVIG